MLFKTVNRFTLLSDIASIFWYIFLLYRIVNGTSTTHRRLKRAWIFNERFTLSQIKTFQYDDDGMNTILA